MPRLALISLLGIGSAAAVVLAQTAEQFPYVGQVTGTNVNVRSGPDTNYYPTTRLSAPAQVTVLGEQFGWLKIEAPPGSFCLIAKEFVVPEQDGTGVVSADGINVRAGSDLSAHRLPILQLDKGAIVKILGEHPDGFYKIEPPKGAGLWISKEFVQPLGGAAPAQPEAPPAAPQPEPTTKPAATRPVEGRYRAMLDALEADLARATDDIPFAQWDLQPFLPRYEQITQQDDELIPKLFAQERLKILRDRIDVQESLRRLHQGGESLQEQRRVLVQQRSALRAMMAETFEPFDAEGEIRKSWVFDSRWRLVDPRTDRTVAYLEAEPDAPDLLQLLGRYVGVRAKRKSLEGRLWVLVPAEITLLEPPGAQTQPAPPQPPASRPVGTPAAPTSQP
jgi:hypothetical protein